MSEKRRQFRLEDEDEGVAPGRVGPSAPRPSHPPVEEVPPEAGAPGAGTAEAAETDVDARTVAERLGRDVTLMAGRRPAPPGWPLEAFSFPLRPPGPGQIAGVATLLVLLDLLAWWNLFAGLVLQVFALVFLLRWQLHVASMSAGGRDASVPWVGALDVRGEDLRPLAFWLLRAALAAGVTAGLFAWVGTAAGVAAGVAGWVWLAAKALALVVGDPRVGRIDGVLAWFSRRPLALLAAPVGWTVASLASWVEFRSAPTSLPLALLLFTSLRVVTVYAWLLGARILGVLGRDWTPYADEPETGAGA